MPVPRRRHCSSRQGKDRAHKKLYASQLVPCKDCGELKLRHRICANVHCRMRKGRVYATAQTAKAAKRDA